MIGLSWRPSSPPRIPQGSLPALSPQYGRADLLSSTTQASRTRRPKPIGSRVSRTQCRTGVSTIAKCSAPMALGRIVAAAATQGRQPSSCSRLTVASARRKRRAKDLLVAVLTKPMRLDFVQCLGQTLHALDLAVEIRHVYRRVRWRRRQAPGSRTRIRCIPPRLPAPESGPNRCPSPSRRVVSGCGP